MIEIEMKCENCRWYEPARNPDTGMGLPSKYGKCTYPVTWVALPKCFLRSVAYRWSVLGENSRWCPTREEKNPPKQKQTDMLT